MSILPKIAYYQNRRDETPNKALARELVETNDLPGVQEIAANLWNDNLDIRCDCLAVMEEIGNLQPEMITGYAAEFLALAGSKNNRLVWGSLIPLARIAHLCPDEIFPHTAELLRLMEGGSVIVVDNSVKILAIVAASNTAYRDEIFPHLHRHLETCRAKDVPQHAESMLVAVDAANRGEFIKVLESRMSALSDAQAKRVRKVIRAA